MISIEGDPDSPVSQGNLLFLLPGEPGADGLPPKPQVPTIYLRAAWTSAFATAAAAVLAAWAAFRFFMISRLSLLAAVVVWCGLLAGAAAQQKTGPLSAGDFDGYAKYFAGTYTLIGQLPAAGAAYCGKVVVAANGREFKVTRTVAGETTEGRAFVDLDPDGNRIFVMQFTQGGHRYEATYLSMNNYDSYPRLTGHVAEPGESKDAVAGYGFEALFPKDDPACATGS